MSFFIQRLRLMRIQACLSIPLKIFISNLQCINFTAFTKPKARRLGVVVNWWKVFDVAAIFLDRDMKFKHHLEFRWRWKFNMFKYQTKDNQPKLLKQVKWKIKDYSKWLTATAAVQGNACKEKNTIWQYIYTLYM